MNENRRSEGRSPDREIRCPGYVEGAEAREAFARHAALLDGVGAWSELYADELARYVVAQEVYEKTSAALLEAVRSDDMDKAATRQRMQDRAFKQAHTSASSLALTPSGFSKLELAGPDEGSWDGYSL